MAKVFAEIFTAFEGPAQLGRALGISTEHAVQMRRRDSIPMKHWPRLIEEAEKRGLADITLDRLTDLAIAKASHIGIGDAHERAA